MAHFDLFKSGKAVANLSDLAQLHIGPEGLVVVTTRAGENLEFHRTEWDSLVSWNPGRELASHEVSLIGDIDDTTFGKGEPFGIVKLICTCGWAHRAISTTLAQLAAVEEDHLRSVTE